MENLYAVGAILQAKEKPQTNLIVNKYYKRIYYCTEVNDASKKLFPFFERELVAPKSH